MRSPLHIPIRRKAAPPRGAALLTVLLLLGVLLVLGVLILTYAGDARRSANAESVEKAALLCAEEGLRRGKQWVGTTRNEVDWPPVFALAADVDADVKSTGLTNPPGTCGNCLAAVSDSGPDARVFVYLMDNDDGDEDLLDDNDLAAIVRSYCVDPKLRTRDGARMVEGLATNTQGGTKYHGQAGGGSERTGNVTVTP